MRGRYVNVATRLWHDEKLRALPEDARHLFLYLLTSPHGNMVGIFYLPELYAMNDLQWEQIRYRRGIDTLSNAHLIATDGDIVWVRNFLRYNPLRGPKQAAGAAARLQEVPESKLTETFVNGLSEYLSRDDCRAFLKAYGIPYRYPIDTLSHTPPIPDPDPETDPESDPETATATDSVKTVVDVEMSKLGERYFETFGTLAQQSHLESMKSYLDDGLTDWHITDALRRTADANAKGWNYTKKILQTWLDKRALTPEDVTALDKERRASNGQDGSVAGHDGRRVLGLHNGIAQDRGSSKWDALYHDDE